MTRITTTELERIRAQVWQIFDAVSEITDDELEKLQKDIGKDIGVDEYTKADENSDDLIAIEGHIVQISSLLTKIEERERVI